MTTGTGGVEYENAVLKQIKKQLKDTKAFSIKEGSSTAAFSAHEPDLQLVAYDKHINIEIKQDNKAQMGGGSYNYDLKSKKFTQSAKTVIDPEINDQIIKILNTKKKDVDRLLSYVKENEMIPLAENVTGLGLVASKKMWEDLTKKGYLIPLNAKIETPIEFLYDHYEHKNCYYIQIGKAGLFYLKKNPLGLPVPQLKMPFTIELRLGRGGSSLNKTLKVETASGNIRAQGRLGGKKISSPYSLDTPGHFTQLFGQLSKNKIVKAGL